MPYLIDGHNLIPKIPGLSLKSLDDEIQLIQLLQDFCRQSGKKVEVYFDNAPAGQAGNRRYGPVKAHFIRAGRTADEAIIARLRSMGRGAKNCQVVTSDRHVAAAARSLYAQVIPSDEFAAALPLSTSLDRSDPGIEEQPLIKQNEIDEWLSLFGDGGEENQVHRDWDEL